MSTANLLNGAADLLERDGWCQGHMKVGKSRCAYRALSDAAGKNSTAIVAALSALRRVGVDYVINWNDAGGRTQDEVVGAMRTAAEQA